MHELSPAPAIKQGACLVAGAVLRSLMHSLTVFTNSHCLLFGGLPLSFPTCVCWFVSLGHAVYSCKVQNHIPAFMLFMLISHHIYFHSCCRDYAVTFPMRKRPPGRCRPLLARVQLCEYQQRPFAHWVLGYYSPRPKLACNTLYHSPRPKLAHSTL